MNKAATLAEMIARWAARILSAMIFVVWGVFLIAHFLGHADDSTRSLNLSDYSMLATLISSMVGLAVAWRWEFAGAAIALVSIGLCAVVNWRVVVFPGLLIPATAVLFLTSWSFTRRRLGSAA